MRKMSDIYNNPNFPDTFKQSLTRLFGSEEFTNDMYVIIDELMNGYSLFGYSTWLYNETEEIDINRYISYVSRLFIKNYKYIDFFRNNWSIADGTIYDDVDTSERVLNGKHDTVSNDNINSNKTHNSTTNMDTTSNYEQNTTTQNTEYYVNETAPIDASITDINTPDTKQKTNENGTVNFTNDRTDNQDITVNSTDENQTTNNSTAGLTINDKETINKKYKNGVEILKAIKYNNMSIYEIVEQILDRTVYEFTIEVN